MYMLATLVGTLFTDCINTRTFSNFLELNAKGKEASAPMKFAKINDLRILNSIVLITNITETRKTANTIKNGR